MKLNKFIVISSLVFSQNALSEVSGNAGYVSDYLYRGIYQSGSSASAGIDYEVGGFYLGAWAADVKEALEYDFYTGYGVEVSDISLSVGVTGYYYTQDWDQTYEEINLGIGYAGFALDYADGEYDATTGATDYEFTSIGYALDNGVGFVYGSFADDGGDYVEISYGFDLAGVEAFVALTLGDDTNTDDALVFGFGRSFSISD
mgnify:CR=1 FL=1|jgi:uncharacterized protein (TIGR02001 family)